jgi:hypothetical protein
MWNRRIPVLMLSLLFVVAGSVAAAEPSWKAGTATEVITPQKAMWMAGYGSRKHPADGKLHELWLKALALEDANGHRAVILSSDTLGIPKTIYDRTCKALEEKFGLSRSQIMFNASHTHCGPVLRGALYDVYPLDDEQKALIEEYSADFEQKVVATVARAIAALEPCALSTGRGICRFAVNRRNNSEPNVPSIRAKNELKGPIDHDVPLLAVRDSESNLKALVFGYACHNTTLSFYKWCGDYAGFAQYALEESHPGVVAMFNMGCGADQNPLPRRKVYECERYGRMLAAAVEDTLLQPMQPLEPSLRTEFEFVELNLADPPAREELERIAGSSNYQSRWAKRLLKERDAGKPFVRNYPYPMQAWKLGGRQLWITMGGEVVVDYSLGFKKLFGPETWVTGYCNDVMAYIPSLRVLEEGGYEGNTSMIVYGMPSARWATDVEDRITTAVTRLVGRVNGE